MTDEPALHVLTSATGLRAEVVPTGAALARLWVPTAGGPRNVVLGHGDLAAYAGPRWYYGATVGRYANRISGGRISVEGVEHALDANETSGGTLHGGSAGFDTRRWTVDEADETSTTLSLLSPDGDQGFPGALTARVTYAVEGDTLSVELTATTDRPTVVNLTNHSYLNLDGEGAGTIDDHRLEVPADTFTPVDTDLLPLGVIAPVEETALDLRAAQRLGDVVRRDDAQLKAAGGIDHNLVPRGSGFRELATLATSDLTVVLSSDAPGLQVCAGEFLDRSTVGPSGTAYGPRAGVALEAQDFPDTVSHPAFGSSLLLPEHTWRRRITWQFLAGDRFQDQPDRR